MIDASCEHGSPYPCSSKENYYIYMPYAGQDFSTFDWFNSKISQPDKFRLLEQLLEGLSTLHRLGIMHRDIRRQNVLLLSLEPAEAAICDFGKATKAESSENTSIGPIYTLAPEVWCVKSVGPYTNSIDIWAFGYAIAELFGYYGWQGNPPINPERYDSMVAMLQTHSSKHPIDEDLVDLVLRMLKWNPKQRPTATEALQHRCWNFIRAQSPLESKAAQEKSIH